MCNLISLPKVIKFRLFANNMDTEYTQQIQTLQEEQKLLMDAVTLSYENLNALLRNQKSKFENQDIVIANQSKIINNQEIIVANQMNIINNQALIVQNQITLRVILELQTNMFKIIRKLSGEDQSEADFAEELMLLTERIKSDFKAETHEIFPFSKDI